MKLIKKMGECLLAASLLLSSGAFAVPTLQFTPSSQTVELGEQATLNIGVSGLSNEYVGTYDFDVNWDSSLLSLNSISFDTFLDGPLDSISSFDNSSAGTVNVFEVSLGALSNQNGSGSINLFSLTFDTLALGVSLLDFSAGIDPFFGFLGDDLGFSLTPSLSNGSITIIEPSNVPEPSTLLLLSAGLILTGLSARRNRSS